MFTIKTWYRPGVLRLIHLALLATTIVLFACSEGHESLGEDAEMKAIIDYFKAQGTDPKQIEFKEEGVIVERDMAFRYDDLKQRIAEDKKNASLRNNDELIEKGYFYTNGWLVNVFPLCMDNQLSGSYYTAFRYAAMRWSQTHAKWAPGYGDSQIQIINDNNGCAGYDEYQTFTVTYNALGPEGFTAQAWGPSKSGDTVYPGDIEVNSDIGPPTFQEMQGTAVHEIGHVIGFMHPGEGNWIAGSYSGGDDDYLTVMKSYRDDDKWHLYPDDAYCNWLKYPADQASCDYFDRDSPDGAFCSADCPCDLGEGDCDYEGTGTQCKYGLICGTDNGPEYGLPSAYDVCVKPTSCSTFNPASPNAGFCNQWGQCPCGIGEGDCDRDADCGGDLYCATDNGAAVGLPDNYDVCTQNPEWGCPRFDPDNLDAEFCSTSCPCGLGEGDCDNDSECRNDLVCASNVGEHFGMGSAWDVCSKPGVF